MSTSDPALGVELRAELSTGGESVGRLDDVVNLKATITVEYTGVRSDYLYAMEPLAQGRHPDLPFGYVPSNAQMAIIDSGHLAPDDFLALGDTITVKVEPA